MPSGENATPYTQLVWPCKVVRVVPVARSQIRAVPSPEAVASRVPSGENATPYTVAGVALQGGAAGAGGKVPDPGGIVVGGGGEQGAVGGECHAVT